MVRSEAALAGVLSAAAGLAVAEIVGGWSGAPTPVVAVGAAVVDRVPLPVKEWAVATFGAADKTVLLGGVLVVLGLLAAGIGVAAARGRRAGLALALVPAALAGLAVLGRPGAVATDLLPTLAGAVTGLVVLDLLTTRLPAIPAEGAPADAESRRLFLRAAAATAVGTALAAGGARWLAGRRASVESARAALDLPRPSPDSGPPAGTSVAVPGVPPWRTPNPAFYRVDTALALPLVHPDDWRLRLHGMVDRELVLDLDALLVRGLVDRWITLTCVSNEVGGDLAGNALWTGVPLAALLAEARPHGSADMLLSTSTDGWTASTPLDALVDGRDALLAVGMNGEPLPVRHGFPVRMVVPGLYGYVSATKWLVDLEVTRFDRAEAYWTSRGWSARAPVKTAARIDVPRDGARLRVGRVAVAGTAWAQHRGIAAVEVRVDGGPWRPARLATVPSSDTWRQWALEWTAAPGEHRVEVRAVDSSGEVQTETVAPPAPDGATGWHGVTVRVA